MVGEMVKNTGFVISSLGLQAGVVAFVFYLLNFAIWAALTAMLGGGIALIGLGLIMWALTPRGANTDDDVKLIEFIPVQAEPA